MLFRSRHQIHWKEDWPLAALVSIGALGLAAIAAWMWITPDLKTAWLLLVPLGAICGGLVGWYQQTRLRDCPRCGQRAGLLRRPLAETDGRQMVACNTCDYWMYTGILRTTRQRRNSSSPPRQGALAKQSKPRSGAEASSRDDGPVTDNTLRVSRAYVGELALESLPPMWSIRIWSDADGRLLWQCNQPTFICWALAGAIGYFWSRAMAYELTRGTDPRVLWIIVGLAIL